MPPSAGRPTPPPPPPKQPPTPKPPPVPAPGGKVPTPQGSPPSTAPSSPAKAPSKPSRGSTGGTPPSPPGAAPPTGSTGSASPPPGSGPLHVFVTNWPPSFGQGQKDKSEGGSGEAKSWDESKGIAEKMSWVINKATSALGYLSNPDSLVQSGQEDRAKGEAFTGSMKEGAGHLMKSVGSGGSTLGGSVGEAMEGAGNVAGNIPVIGGPIEAVTKFGKGLLDASDKLHDWTNQLHDMNMQFAQFSGEMAMVQANQQVRDIKESQLRGERLAPSAEKLAESKFAAEHQENRIKDWWKKNISDPIATGFNEIKAEIIKAALPKEEEPPKDEGITMGEYFDEAGEESPWEKYNRPERFGGR